MSMETFDFCPNSQVPELVPPEPVQGMSMNGWNFGAKPTVPFQAQYRVTLHGLHWYLGANDMFDTDKDKKHNARVLELFYQNHLTWKPFTWKHPHIGNLTCRFSEAVVLPRGIENAGGLLEPVEVMMVHHNPGFA